MRFFGFLCTLLAGSTLLLQSAAHSETPSKMIHATIRMTGDGIKEDSFAAKPKTFYRATHQYCRIEEEPDPENGIHGQMIINEPDAWLVNLADHSAKHLLDKGPTFNCKLPIFAMSPEMAKSKVGELEVGHEIEFFEKNGARAIDGPKLSFDAKYYELQLGDYSLRLVERVEDHAPVMVALLHGEDAYTANYLLWEEIPFKADLFAKPVGARIEEVN